MAEALQKVESVSERIAEALGKLAEKAPEESKKLGELMKAIEEKNIAILGEDEAFRLRDTSGEIRAFRSMVHLSATDGTLVQPVPKGPYVVSAQGYERWEEAAGAITMKPPFVLVGDQMLQNPHVERDPKNGRIMAIHCRTIAFRFTSKGIPQVSDWTTIFDVPAYRLIDLLSKAKQVPQAFRLLPIGQKPDDESFKAKVREWDVEKEKTTYRDTEVNPTWAAYPFDEATVFWVCTSHPEALTWYAQILNREKKAMDFAQTFSKRNSLKHLSGIQRVPGQDGPDGKVMPIKSWAVPVICWRPTSGSIVKWDMTQYANVSKALVRAAGGDTSALMIEASKGKEFLGEDPAITQEMVEIEEAEAESGVLAESEQEAKVEDKSSLQPAVEDTQATSELLRGNGAKQTQPEKFNSHKSKKEKGREELPLPQERVSTPTNSGFFEEKKPQTMGSPMDQVKALEKLAPQLFKQACMEEEMARPMSDSGALIILKKAEEISKRKVKK